VNILLNVKKINAQLEEKMYINNCDQSGGYITIQYYNNCGEPRYNIYICKKDEEISNSYI